MNKNPSKNEQEGAAALSEMLAEDEVLTGVPAVVAELRSIDEDAQVLWKIKGPRGTSTTSIAAILFTPGGPTLGSIIVIVQEFASGKCKVHAEVPLSNLTRVVLPTVVQPAGEQVG